MGYDEIDISVSEAAERVYMYPAVRPQTVYGSTGFLRKLEEVFGFRETLVLGVSSLPVLKAFYISDDDPAWFSLICEIERVGPIVIARKGGWEWRPPQEEGVRDG